MGVENSGLAAGRARVVARGRTERKREAILEAAENVFLRDGFGAAGMDEIAREAGVSKQTIYAHFGTKHELFAAIVTALSAGSGARGHDIAPPDDDRDAERNFASHAARELEAALTPAVVRLRRLVIAEAARFPELAADFHEHGAQRAVTALAREISRLAHKGVLEVDDPRAAAIDFYWLVIGEPVNRALLLGDDAVPSARALRAHAERAAEVFLAAYERR